MKSEASEFIHHHRTVHTSGEQHGNTLVFQFIYIHDCKFTDFYSQCQANPLKIKAFQAFSIYHGTGRTTPSHAPSHPHVHTNMLSANKKRDPTV
jgi:hypothetical protein